MSNFLPTRSFVQQMAAVAVSAVLAAALLIVTTSPAQAADVWAPQIDVGSGYSPQIAISADGTRAVAVWEFNNGDHLVIQSATAIINGSMARWGSPVTISESDISVERPKVAISADGGRAIAVWRGDSDGQNLIQSRSATLSGTSVTWGSINNVGFAQIAFDVQVAMSADGTRALATWYASAAADSWSDGTRSAVAAINGAETTWFAPWFVGSGYNAQLAMSADGSKATAAWVVYDSGSFHLESASATISGSLPSWGEAQRVSPDSGAAYEPRLALTDSGDEAVLTWWLYDGTKNRVQAATAGVDGTTAVWGAVQELSGPEGGYRPELDVAADGTHAVVVWMSGGSTQSTMSTSATVAGSTASWGTASILSDANGEAWWPKVALSADGTRAFAAWSYDDGLQFSTQTATASIDELGVDAAWGSLSSASSSGLPINDIGIGLSDSGTRATVFWRRGDSPTVQSASAMLFTPAAPTLGFAADTLTITPPADTGGSPITAYQISYTTQARINAGNPNAVWATFWPAGNGPTTTINLGTYQRATACNPVAATATPYPGRCARALGEHTRGRTFIYQVTAINADGRGPATTISVTR